MSYDGNGNYTVPSGSQGVGGTVIDAVKYNTLLSDLQTALTKGFLRDGQSAALANLPMGGFKLTGLAAATANGDAVRFEQLAAYATSGATFNVKDYGALGNDAADDTTAIAAAITAISALGGGNVLFPPGTYRISSTLTIPGKVTLIGAGAGRVAQPVQAAATSLAWYGGASEMVRFGWQGATVASGGVSNMRLNGRAIATRCLSIKDAQHGRFDDLVLTGSITSALYMTNTDTYDPTGFCVFENLQISLRGGSTNAAHGIHLDGVGTGASGVTLNHFIKPRIEHANGDGLRLGLRADGNTFVDYYSFRANAVETGYGINVTSTSVSAINTTNKFLGSTVPVGGIFVAVPSATTAFIGSEGTDFVKVNITELASDLTDRFNPFQSVGRVFGHGATDKRMRTGFARLQHEHQGHSYDTMRFVAYAHPLVNTNQGAWFAVRNGAGGLVGSALQPGGAVALTTGAAGTDDISIYAAADFTSGITFASNPICMLGVAPASTATVRHQWGMFGDAALPDPTNGIYVQFDAAVNANYQLISRKAGVSTTITTTVAGAAAKRYWLFCLDDTQNALYFTKLASETQWTYLGINASVPIVALLAGFRCRAQAAANRDLHVYSCEFGHVHE